MKAIIGFTLLKVGLFIPASVYALTFGIFPQYQPLKLAELNAPLINHLNKSLPEAVYFRTADSFSVFNRRARNQDYDIVMIAPNLGYQLTVKNLYKPVLHVRYRPQAVFVVPKNSSIQLISDLKKKNIAFPPDLAITTKVAYKKLAEIGLEKSDYNAMNRKSHLESLRWLALNKSDAAALTRAVWEARPDEEKMKYKTIGFSDSSPGIFLLVKDEKWFKPVRKALLDFESTPEGAAYFKETKLIGYKPVTDIEMSEIGVLYP